MHRQQPGFMKPERLYLLDKVAVGDYSVAFGRFWHTKRL
ncbi:hypothetical protein IAE39_004818 [Pseudomonas sp. S37]|nr:hypothetical protein [Pseudomonas sp. S37]